MTTKKPSGSHSGKSQIQRIAEGEGERQKREPWRAQPQGQAPRMLKGNAARLASVPSSASEKYDGGKDS